jgi:hypothetical protein
MNLQGIEMKAVDHAINDDYLNFKQDLYKICRERMSSHPVIKEYTRRMDNMENKLQKYKEIRELS